MNMKGFEIYKIKVTLFINSSTKLMQNY